MIFLYAMYIGGLYMIDGITLDYLRTFVAAAEEGSFSAAGRKLGRAQPVVSQTIASLESQFGVALFERTGRYPQLTPDGKSLLPAARQLVLDADNLKARARSLSLGLEAELSVVIDVMFPQRLLTDVVTGFARTFRDTPLRLHVESLGAVAELVLDGRCSIGVMGTYPAIPPSLSSERLFAIEFVTVASPKHIFADWNGAIPLDRATSETQLVLTDRSTLTKGKDFGVQSANTWRLADLGAKHAFLLAGLGWGHMPLPVVDDDIKAGRLTRIALEGPGPGLMPLQAIYKTDARPGPAAQWFLERVRSAAALDESCR
jgi:DNA-binding transcriptional LysR family regulator